MAMTQAGRRCGAVRVAAAVPAMLASVFILVLALGWMAAWEPVALLGWLAAGLAVLSRAGERLAVRALCRFRTPTPAQAAALAGPWAAALEVAGIPAAAMDLYVDPDARINAWATGRRSVAVTVGAVTAAAAQPNGEDYLTALLVHELGHHAVGGGRLMLSTTVLAAPARVLARVVAGVCLWRRSRRSVAMLVAVAGACMTVAAVQTALAGQLVAAAGVLGVAGTTVLCPLLDAAACRRAELLADEFAAACGCGASLAAVLTGLPVRRRPSAVRPGLWSRHPGIDARLDVLGSAAGR